MSRVLLGLEDAPLTAAERARPDPTASRLGGAPHWWCPVDRENPPCGVCGRVMPLVVQIYAPIGDSVYHRTLYIFGCVGAECANRTEAWCCLREQSRAVGCAPSSGGGADGTEPARPAAAAASDWLESADDWDSDDDEGGGGGGGAQTPLSDRLQGLTLAGEKADWGAAPAAAQPPAADAAVSAEQLQPPGTAGDLRQLVSARPQPPAGAVHFRPAHLAVVEEPPTQKGASSHEMDLLRCYQKREGINLAQLQDDGGGGGGGDSSTAAQESYESAAPAHGDRLLYKLKRRLQLQPAQLLRYCRDGGAPLPLQPLPGQLPTCGSCGAARVFELQLLPTLVPRLVADGEGGDGGLLEFGTVLVYTCRESCWRDGDHARTEVIVVQAEQ